jgi:hypothetical protein
MPQIATWAHLPPTVLAHLMERRTKGPTNPVERSGFQQASRIPCWIECFWQNALAATPAACLGRLNIHAVAAAVEQNPSRVHGHGLQCKPIRVPINNKPPTCPAWLVTVKLAEKIFG